MSKFDDKYDKIINDYYGESGYDEDISLPHAKVLRAIGEGLIRSIDLAARRIEEAILRGK